jgi:hypothetical protein
MKLICIARNVSEFSIGYIIEGLTIGYGDYSPPQHSG